MYIEMNIKPGPEVLQNTEGQKQISKNTCPMHFDH